MKTKKIIFSLAAFLTAFTFYAQPPGSGWGNPIFADEFNGSSVNTNTWRINNPGSEFFANQVSVSGGKLIIKNNLVSNNKAGRRGGWVDSKASFGPGGSRGRYGYFEARIRINRQGINFPWQGGKIWPTWWVWGSRACNSCPTTTEFDIMEYSRWTNFKADGNATSSHHYYDKRNINGKSKFDITQKNSPRDEFNWHRWGMLWTPTQVTFYYDGVPFGSSDQPRDPLNDTRPLKLIFSSSPHVASHRDLAASGAPRVSDILPQFEIDWVRVWQGGNPGGGNNGGGNNGGGNSSAPVGQTISFHKKGGDKQYVTAEGGGNNQLIARGGTAAPTQNWKTWERYIVESHPSGDVALKALSTNKYIQVSGNNANVPIRAVGNQKQAWERFKWVNGSGNNEFGLQSVQSGKWIQAPWNQNNSVLYPRGNAFNTWETFVWINNPSAKLLDANGASTIDISPNPVNSGDSISISTNVQDSSVAIDIFNIQGSSVYSSSESNLENGPATLSIPASFSSGIYIIKVSTGGQTVTEKLVISN